MARDARTLLRNRLLSNLHQDLLPRLQQVADRRQVRRLHRAAAAIASTTTTRPRVHHAATIARTSALSNTLASVTTSIPAPATSALALTLTRRDLALRNRGRGAAILLKVRSLGKLLLLDLADLATRDFLFFHKIFIAGRREFVLFEILLFIEVFVLLLFIESHRLMPRNVVDRHVANHAAEVRRILQRLLFRVPLAVITEPARLQRADLRLLLVQQFFFELASARRKSCRCLKRHNGLRLRLTRMHRLHNRLVLNRSRRIGVHDLRMYDLGDQLAAGLQDRELVLRNGLRLERPFGHQLLNHNLRNRRVLTKLTLPRRIDAIRRRSILIRLIFRRRLVELGFWELGL